MLMMYLFDLENSILVYGVAFYHLILVRKKAGDLFQISCLMCRCVGGEYLVVVIYQLEKSKLKTSIFFEFVSSGIPFASINFVSFHIIDD